MGVMTIQSLTLTTAEWGGNCLCAPGYSSAMTEKKRCDWVNPDDPYYVEYHDNEWGVPSHDDRKLFELLVLEGAQAGLNWKTILVKREGYRTAFAGFEPRAVAAFDQKVLNRIMKDPGIVRNKLKVESTIANAKALLAVQKEFGSFDKYIWSFVSGKPIRNKWKSLSQIPAVTPEATQMSKDLIKRGFRFVGPTICYAFMQAVGMVNDHQVSCYRHKEIDRLS